MDRDNFGGLVGCAIFIGIILGKVGTVVVIIYVAWHFISKYW